MIYKMPKISLIGIGKVVSTIAYSILLKGLASEMVLVDYNRKIADGDALDLLHASNFAHPMQIRSGDLPIPRIRISLLSVLLFRQRI